MTRLNSQSGVTLIELLVAVTLLSGLSVGMLFALRIVSGLLAATGLLRLGIRHFWSSPDRPAPRPDAPHAPQT